MARDILTKPEGDLNILNGDLDVGYSDEQHVEHILITSKGHFKQNPLIGVGIEDYINSPTSLITRQKLEKEIALQLESDNAKDIDVSYSVGGVLKVEATYE